MVLSTTPGAGIPTLIDCWRVRDLHRFRAVLKGGPAAAGLPNTGHYHQGSSYSKSPSHHSYGGGGSQGTSSWSNAHFGPAPPSEVNRKDHFGRTALHLVASSDEGISIDFLLALLSHPSCNVNAQDGESGYTALHRALYHGNLNHALTLLRHTSIDVRLKDAEGLSAFDLYNSTVSGTNPVPPNLLADPATRGGASSGDLSLWGSNRNYTLGLGDGNDRSLPDSVTLKRQTLEDDSGRPLYPLAAGRKFDRITVREVQMSKMHTVVITDESAGGNVWVAGIGSNGRLGRSSSTQPTLTPLSDFKETAASVAVGPDHTLIVTTSGSVYSFGLNKFGVLGYTLESGQGLVASSGGGNVGSSGTPNASSAFGGVSTSNKVYDVQITPRKIVGPLKKEEILGVAVSKLHSAAFSADALYTWGSNTGQLGYDKTATPLQVLPRKVTSLTSTVRQVACTDHATALLLSSFDVLVYHGDLNFRLQFPMSRFSDKMSVFRPRQAQPKPSIAKITSSGSTFAALSDYGDLFTFSLNHPSEYATGSSVSSNAAKRIPAPEPQLVWSVRKKFTAVRDVAISLDGSIILCTSSGHVFVRSRRSGDAMSVAKSSSKTGSARTFKFSQIPLLQRVIKVATNESGGFAAIRGQPPLKDIRIKGRTLEEDLLDSVPFLRVPSDRNCSGDEKDSHIATEIGVDAVSDIHNQTVSDEDEDESDDDGGGSLIQRHSAIASLIAEAARRWEKADEKYGPTNLDPPLGCDMFIIAGGRYLPAHRAILSARIQRISGLLDNPPEQGTGGAPDGVVVRRPRSDVTTMVLPRCSFHTALFLLYYLYTDDLPAIWTASIGIRIEQQLNLTKIDRSVVQSQLKELASVLALPALTPCLNSPVARTPIPTLQTDLQRFFDASVSCAPDSSSLHDIELQLADRVVPAHSIILRRSPFFSTLLKPDWSSPRWQNGLVTIDLSHLRWDVVRVHLRYLYSDAGAEELLNGLDVDKSQDEWIDYLTELLGASNELLLDRLKLICCSFLRARMSPTNIGALLAISDTFYALPLKEASLLYCAQNLESLLEGGMLDELEQRSIRELTKFIKSKQNERLHRSLHADQLAALLVNHQEYHDALDIPPPSLNLACYKVAKRPPLPSSSSRRAMKKSSSPFASPELRPSLPSQDSAFFEMDEDAERSPSLGAIADRSLGLRRDQPGFLALPETQNSGAVAGPWSTRVRRDTKPSQSKGPDSSFLIASDLRSIMAAQEARTSPSTPLPTTRMQPSSAGGSSTASGAATPTRSSGLSSGADVNGSTHKYLPDLSSLTITPKLSQKDRKKLAQQQMVTSTSQDAPVQLASTGRIDKGSPWKLNDPASPTPVAPVVEQSRTPIRSKLPSGSTSELGHRAPSGSSQSSEARPTFTPVKGSAMRSLSRNVSDTVWAKESSRGSSQDASYLSAPQSAAEQVRPHRISSGQSSPIPSPRPSGMTFTEIQAQQKAAAAASEALNPAKKSFAEIQAEDRRAEQERIQAEKDRLEFEKWFEEESRRVKVEQRAVARQAGSSSRGGKKKTQSIGAQSQSESSKGKENGKQGKKRDTSVVASQEHEPNPSSRLPQKGSEAGKNHSGSTSQGSGASGRGGRGGKSAATHTKKQNATDSPTSPTSNNGQPSQRPPASPALLSATAPAFQPSAAPQRN